MPGYVLVKTLKVKLLKFVVYILIILVLLILSSIFIPSGLFPKSLFYLGNLNENKINRLMEIRTQWPNRIWENWEILAMHSDEPKVLSELLNASQGNSEESIYANFTLFKIRNEPIDRLNRLLDIYNKHDESSIERFYIRYLIDNEISNDDKDYFDFIQMFNLSD